MTLSFDMNCGLCESKGPSKGTGIDLFMAKVIVEQNMGGRLTAVNTENGAEFRIEV